MQVVCAYCIVCLLAGAKAEKEFLMIHCVFFLRVSPRVRLCFPLPIVSGLQVRVVHDNICKNNLLHAISVAPDLLCVMQRRAQPVVGYSCRDENSRRWKLVVENSLVLV